MHLDLAQQVHLQRPHRWHEGEESAQGPGARQTQPLPNRIVTNAAAAVATATHPPGPARCPPRTLPANALRASHTKCSPLRSPFLKSKISLHLDCDRRSCLQPLSARRVDALTRQWRGAGLTESATCAWEEGRGRGGGMAGHSCLCAYVCEGEGWTADRWARVSRSLHLSCWCCHCDRHRKRSARARPAHSPAHTHAPHPTSSCRRSHSTPFVLAVTGRSHFFSAAFSSEALDLSVTFL